MRSAASPKILQLLRQVVPPLPGEAGKLIFALVVGLMASSAFEILCPLASDGDLARIRLKRCSGYRLSSEKFADVAHIFFSHCGSSYVHAGVGATFFLERF